MALILVRGSALQAASEVMTAYAMGFRVANCASLTGRSTGLHGGATGHRLMRWRAGSERQPGFTFGWYGRDRHAPLAVKGRRVMPQGQRFMQAFATVG